MCFIPCKEEREVIEKIRPYFLGYDENHNAMFTEDCPQELIDARAYWVQYHKDHFFEEVNCG